jgi:hypothetical protein
VAETPLIVNESGQVFRGDDVSKHQLSGALHCGVLPWLEANANKCDFWWCRVHQCAVGRPTLGDETDFVDAFD